MLMFTDIMPFPILPPPGGWNNQVISFMLGLGITDSIAILLGIAFAYQACVKQKLNRRMGVISLTIFISGAIVFAIGTIPSGAWAINPIAYGVMVMLFLPIPVLYHWLLRSNLKPKC